nr:hypothetical protein [Tanacetum cinerariifolium]
MQTQTSNTLHNAIMEAGGKDRLSMLAPGILHTSTHGQTKMFQLLKEVLKQQLKVDACPKACEMWKAIKRLKQGESINVQDLETNLYWEFGKFTSRDGESLESYYSRFYKMMNDLVRNQCDVINHQVNVQFLLQLQPEWQRNRGKAIVNSSPPIYDQEPSMVAEDDEIGTGYDNKRIGNVVGARETLGTTMVQKYEIQCYNCKEFGHVERECQKPKKVKDAAYHKEKMLLYAADDSGPIFDTEPLQKVSNNDNYNVFAIESEHPEQSKSVNDTYLIEQHEHNVIIDSLDMSYDREHVDQDDDDDDDDLANERNLLASLVEKLKCEIDDSKNRNKFLETSNKFLVDKLKGQIEDFKTKNKSLESSNNHFKKANNELSKTNELMYKDLKKFQAELDRHNDVKYASKVELDSMKKELFAHQETISILSQAKEAQLKFYKTREDKEIDKVIALENKVKVLDNTVYKTSQTVQTMNMLNRNCRTSFAKPEFLKKAQRANPRLYDIGCYNDNLALMLAPESEEVIRLEKESRSKSSDLIRPFDYEKLNKLYDLFVSQREKSSEQKYFSERSKMSHTPVNNGNSKGSFNKQTTLLEKRMDKSIPYDQKCKSSKELFKFKRSVGTIIDGVERCKQTITKRTYFGHIDPFIQNTIEGNFCPEIRRINIDLEKFHLCLKEEMVADLRYFNSLELEVDSLKSQLETQKTQLLNEIDRLLREYYYADHMNAILDVYTKLDEVTNLQCDYLELLEKYECLEKELSKSKIMSKSFEALQKHAINLELNLQQCQEKIKNDKSFKDNQSKIFCKEREQFVIQDLKAQLQDKGIAIRMYKLHTKLIQTRTTQLPYDFRKTNKRVSFSTGVIPTTSVSRPQLKSNQMEDRVMLNNSQGKKQEVEDHRRNVKFSKNKTSVTACNDSLNAKTSNVNFVCATCRKSIWLYVNGFGVGEKRYVVVMGTWGWQAMGCATGDKREKGRGVRGLGLGRMPEVVVCAVVELLWGVEGFVGVERGLWSAISDCISEHNPKIKQFRRASLDNPVDGSKRVSRAWINSGHVLRRLLLDKCLYQLRASPVK